MRLVICLHGNGLVVLRTWTILSDDLANRCSFDAVDNVVARSGHKMAIAKDMYILLRRERSQYAESMVERQDQKEEPRTLPSNSALSASYFSSRSQAYTLAENSQYSRLDSFLERVSVQ
jgi:hypothetical protein